MSQKNELHDHIWLLDNIEHTNYLVKGYISHTYGGFDIQ